MRLPFDVVSQLRRDFGLKLPDFAAQLFVGRPVFSASDAFADEMVLSVGSLGPLLDRIGVKVESVVDVDLRPARNCPDDPDNLVVLVAQPHRVRVTAVVEKRHGGEDGASDGQDVELGDVVVLQNAFRHLQAVGGRDLQVPKQQT